VKPDVNSVKVHPLLRHKGQPVDGVLVGAGSLWPWVHLTMGPPSLKRKN
jgi:hypothetical protein